MSQLQHCLDIAALLPFAVAALMFIEYMNRRIKAEIQPAQVAGLPVIDVLPNLQHGGAIDVPTEPQPEAIDPDKELLTLATAPIDDVMIEPAIAAAPVPQVRKRRGRPKKAAVA